MSGVLIGLSLVLCFELEAEKTLVCIGFLSLSSFALHTVLVLPQPPGGACRLQPIPQGHVHQGSGAQRLAC